MTQREAQEMADRVTADLQRVQDHLAELHAEEARLKVAWRELCESLRAEGWFIPLDGIVRRDWRRTRAFAHGAR